MFCFLNIVGVQGSGDKIMYSQQVTSFVKLLRRPRDVVITIVSRLRARWMSFRSGNRVAPEGKLVQFDDLEKRLESEVRFVTSVVSGIVENTLPGRDVSIRARLKGDRQLALRFLNGYLAESAKSD